MTKAELREMILLGCIAGEEVIVNRDVLMLVSKTEPGGRTWLIDMASKLRHENQISYGYDGATEQATFFRIKGHQ